MKRFNPSEFNRQIREAGRRAQQAVNREIDRVNRANKRAVGDYNRKADAHNRRVVADLNRRLQGTSHSLQYTEPELRLAERVYSSVGSLDSRDYDAFLSYARIDGAEVAALLRENLEELGVAVWFDAVAIVPGRSQSLQMDAGLRKARSGIALLTPSYLTGRFWTERELASLLAKETLIPVLHNVTFEDVKEYSGILPDLAGFTTEHDSIAGIARKIAAAIMIQDEGQ